MRKRTANWARKYFRVNGELFDPDSSIRDRKAAKVLDILDRRRGAKVVILANAQSFKTLAVTIWIMGAMCLRRIRAGWYSQSAEAVAQWADEKFNPSFEANDAIQRQLPDDKNRVTKLNKRLVASHLQLLSAGTLLHRQQKSFDVIVMDEAWTYNPGEIKEIRNRVGSFRDTYVEILPSTGGYVGDELEATWRDSDQAEWCMECLSCHGFHPYDFFPPALIPPAKRTDDRGELVSVKGEEFWRPWGGLHFEKGDSVHNPDGTMNWPAFRATVEYECPLCGERHKWSKTLQARINERADFIPQNKQAEWNISGVRSTAMSDVPWPEIAVEWMKAYLAKQHGDFEPMRVVYQTLLAKFWDVRFTVENESTALALGDYLFKERWDEADHTFMTVDVQQHHYWVVIRQWRNDTHSRLVWCGKVLDEGHLRTLQLEYGIKDHGGDIQLDEDLQQYTLPRGCGVYLDGNYNPTEVRRLAAKYHWVVLHGDDVGRFRHPDGGFRIYNIIQPVRSFEGIEPKAKIDQWVAEIRFANDDARNTLATIQSIVSPVRIFTQPRDIEQQCPDYSEHMRSWIRQAVKRKKDNAYYFHWRKVHESDRDDLFWCEKAQIVVAAMHGLVGGEAIGVESALSEIDSA